jgi:hypothetical protein
MYVTAGSLNLDQFGRCMKHRNCLKNTLVRSFALALPIMKWTVVRPSRTRQRQFPWCSHGFWCIVDLQHGRALAHGNSQNGLKVFRFSRTPRVRAHKVYWPCRARRATPTLYRTSQALENRRTRIMLKISWVPASFELDQRKYYKSCLCLYGWLNFQWVKCTRGPQTCNGVSFRSINFKSAFLGPSI